ncbi:nitroreductase family protein [Kutzneria viridogrisea]|uniref:Nitroreductase n=1 Tax=Kutzneria viridogrisea TaxID=47990 RepID=A0ABR6BVD5_9PSEU|nr:nitroreductase [Kutzneria viridogrisea]
MSSSVPGSLRLTPEEVMTALLAAGRAPSLHNTQPWRFRVLSSRIELHADTRRRLPVTDPHDRELRIACGAALLNLRLAIEALGVESVVTLAPSTREAGLLAVVRHTTRNLATSKALWHFDLIGRRRTCRGPFKDVPVPAEHVLALARSARAERCWLHVVTDPSQRREVLSLVREAHQRQVTDPAYITEMAGLSALNGASGPETQNERTRRDYHGASTRAQPSPREPLLLVLCSYLDDQLGELQAGQAMQRVLLAATELDMRAAFLSQPTEVPELRARLRRAVDPTLTPQVVLHIGYGEPAPPTQRRPVADLVMDTGGAP